MQTGSMAPMRRHADELKARMLAACAVPGASVAAAAQAHGLNANLVHKWRRGCGSPMHGADRPVRSAVTAGAEVIALTLPATTVASPAADGCAIATPAADIRIEWRRGSAAIAVSWPVSARVRPLAAAPGRQTPPTHRPPPIARLPVPGARCAVWSLLVASRVIMCPFVAGRSSGRGRSCRH